MLSRPSALLFSLTVLFLVSPAEAGSVTSPEITDQPNDSDALSGQLIPPLEVTKGWVETRGDRFTFNIQLAALDEVPSDGVYVFHYTWKQARFYYRLNWSADQSELRWSGGLYEGGGFDQQGNRQYLYLPSGGNVSQYLKGEVKNGAPATLVWSYPLDRYGEDRRNLEFKGMFISTYQKQADGSLQLIDTAVAQTDYVHKIYTPWWKKFTPGPSPFVALAAIAGLLAVVRGQRSRNA